MHFLYVALLIIFINEVYIKNDISGTEIFNKAILLGIVYPSLYECRQVYLSGYKEYFSSLGNISDIIYIFGSVANVYLQNKGCTYLFGTKLVMTIILLQQIIKTFFFLRLFE